MGKNFKPKHPAKPRTTWEGMGFHASPVTKIVPVKKKRFDRQQAKRDLKTAVKKGEDID